MTHLGTFVSVWLACAPALDAAVAPTLLAAPQEQQPSRPDAESKRPQNGDAAAQIERLRAELAQPGAEGARQRLAAIEHVLSLTDLRAHALLIERIADADDPDGVRAQTLEALVRRLRNPIDPVFGETAPREARLRMVRAYAEALATFWFDEATIEGIPAGELGALAREAIVLMPPRVLIEAQRQILDSKDSPIALQLATLRAAGDTQDLQFGGMLADYLASEDPAVQASARTALRYLTFHEATFETKEQYEAWAQINGQRTYVDLAEDAARRAARREREHLEQLQSFGRDAAAQVVRALTDKRKGIAWSEVQARTLVEDAETFAACLDQLRLTLADGVPAEDSPDRLVFARALLARYRGNAAADKPVRPALLEVAAAVARSTDQDLSAEVTAELLTQLSSDDAALQAASMRSLRRFQSPEARAAIVAVATEALDRSQEDPVFVQAMQTLSVVGDQAWRSPADGGIGRAEWHALIRRICLGEFVRERRNEAIAMAMLVDRDGKRAPESFDLLLEIAKTAALEPDFRNACLIHLQAWREDPVRADMLVQSLASLLGDAERDVRLFAADALSRLPEGAEEQKKNWIRTIVLTLRERLQAEANPAVLRAMLACLVACSRDPGEPGAAIGALNVALDAVGPTVPEDQQARVAALLQTLTELAADPGASQGQWIGACEMLVRHQRRRMLRHVLVSHNAIQLAKDTRSQDSSLASRARSAMRFVLLAALQKPEQEAWDASDELRREAADVRAAFLAIPPGAKLPESIESPALRLMRLQVLLATGGYSDAIALCRAWLDERDPTDWEPLGAVDQDIVRYALADAQARGGKLADAVQTLAKFPQTSTPDPRLAPVAERLGRAFLASDVGRAVEWFTVSVRGTKDEDPMLRTRLVALWEARLLQNPQDRAAVLAEMDRRSSLFDAADCPEDIKLAISRLRSGKAN